MSQTSDVKNKIIMKIIKICSYIKILKFSTRVKKNLNKSKYDLGENL